MSVENRPVAVAPMSPDKRPRITISSLTNPTYTIGLDIECLRTPTRKKTLRKTLFQVKAAACSGPMAVHGQGNGFDRDAG